MKIPNTLSILLGTVLILIAAQWIFTPQTAAESLSMAFLDGDGRNTQIRDFTALFLSTSLMCYASFFTKKLKKSITENFSIEEIKELNDLNAIK